MKSRVFSVLFVFLGMLSADEAREAAWKKVEEAKKKDQPKTQIALLREIEGAALGDEEWAEASRAMAQRIAIEGEIEGEALVIKKLDQELGGAPPEMKPLLRALAAGWMHGYYRRNQWRFAQRSSTGVPVGDDLETWDLARILKEIDARMQAALADEEALKALPVTNAVDLLTESDYGDEWRPTLFDFVAHQALGFYALEEVAVSRPVEAFVLKADSPVFGSVEEFLEWKPDTPDQESPKFRALKIYQKLLQFHLNDEDRSAFYLADLERLKWAGRAAEYQNRDERLEAALRARIGPWKGHPVSALVRLDLGKILIGEDKAREAHEVLSAGMEEFPNHPFGKLCRNEVIRLEKRTLDVSTENHWTPAGEEIHVAHTNVNHVWFRLYSIAFKPGKNTIARDPLPDSGKWLPAMLKGKPVRAWDHALVDESDFRTRTVSFQMPDDLPDGYHILVASAAEDFSMEDNAIAITGVHITPFALTVGREGDGSLEGYVLDAVTGAPLGGIAIEGKVEVNDVIRTLKSRTDDSGYFRLEKREHGRFLVVASRGVQRAVVRTWAGGRRFYDEKDQDGVVFFTDRAIYRPGQSIQFKGIWYLRNQSAGKYELIPNKAGAVILLDPKRKEIGRVAIKTNERGSFSGSFPAPEGGLLGACYLQMEGMGIGSVVRVEEYKRPKFFAEVDPPLQAVTLGEKVSVKVRAEAYTGAPVDGAKVTWRVRRTARLPAWTRWCWWIEPASSSSEEIGSGVLETGADGSVIIEFAAKPDGAVSPDLEPVFDYLVTADVTGGAGETRSATRLVSVGYTSLRASLACEDWLEAGSKLDFKVRTESLDGEGRPAKGILRIHQLKEPEVCPRPSRVRGLFKVPPGESTDPNRWEPGEMVAEMEVATDEKGEATISSELEAGAYRLVFESVDANGRKIQALRGIQVVNPEAESFPTKMPFYTELVADSVTPGSNVSLLWGSGHQQACACVEWFQNGRLLKRQWSDKDRTQQVFDFSVEEKNRGGITVVVHQVTMNRLHQFNKVIQVPWTNKDLTLRWERLVSKLQPGAKETWTAVIEAEGGEAAVAEMVATMYDASLDAYAPHGFRTLSSLLRWEYGVSRSFGFSSALNRLSRRASFSGKKRFRMGTIFRDFRKELAIYDGASWGSGWGSGGGGGIGGAVSTKRSWRPRNNVDSLYFANEGADSGFGARPTPLASSIVTAGLRSEGLGSADGDLGGGGERRLSQKEGAPGPDVSKVTARKNLEETAFFFPSLTSDEDGKVRVSFTMPEALTKWRFLGMAHDGDFRSGYLEGEAVTAKDLMVQPNPPRFLREGDVLEFSVKVTNQSDQEQAGMARLTLVDGVSDEDRTADLGVGKPDQDFAVPAKESRTLKWRLKVPSGTGFLKYKAVAATGNLSDGEEGWLPVVSNRVLVTESMSLPIRGSGKKAFEFTKLLESGKSKTLDDRFLHVQAVSQPAWYAVMALPYLMEYPHECSEQTFNRYYANALARHIAGSDPAIRDVFEQWRAGGEALDSPLMKNSDLKGILLEETPWLREAQDESEARRRVGLLFNENRMERELELALRKLSQMQLRDGLWPWFPGGRGNEYLSLYITTGFGRLRSLGVETNITPALKSLPALDRALTRRYEDIRKEDLGKNHLSPWVAHHLYTRTFFLKDRKLSQRDKVAFDYFVSQGRKFWAELGSRFSRAHLALALHRLADQEVPKLITRSLKEHAKVTEEQGMFWKDDEGEGWHWWQAPIETQAMMIEAFLEIDQDDAAVDDCQVWMIKQKQVGDWKTTKATADAVYALLMGGRDLLASKSVLKVSLGGKEVMAEKVEAGTGFYESRIVGDEVKPKLGKIELTKEDEGVSWASIHWQYLEDLSKVTKSEGGALALEKKLFVRKDTDQGPVLMPLEGEVAIGDELVTRIILRNDRAMEFIHLKDHRGSGTEPMNVLSGYRWQDGFGYYETTRDAASHFFIDRLPPGVHVFETSVRIQHGGKYQTGMAEVRCLYAPEFVAHSASVEITAK